MPAAHSQETIDKMLETYQQGHSVNATARIAGVSPAFVHTCLRRNNLIGIRPRKLSQKKIAKILQLYESGLSGWEVARRVGCKQETVVKYVRKSGMKPRTHKESMQGPGNPAWKGGRVIDKDGYVCLWHPEHPYANSGGYVREHRLVVEKQLGRYLTPQESVHHKDKNKQNNLPDNLRLFASNGEHLAFELKGQIPKWTEDGKRRIREAHVGLRGRKYNRRQTKSDGQQ